MGVGQGSSQDTHGLVDMFATFWQTVDPPTVACAVALGWISLCNYQGRVGDLE